MDADERVELDLRKDLERVLRRLADRGKIPGQGEREMRMRLDRDGHLRWIECVRVKVPASELEA